VYYAGVGQCLIGQGFALASSALRKMLGIELHPERVGSANSIELFTNEATSKKSLPKILLRRLYSEHLRGRFSAATGIPLTFPVQIFCARLPTGGKDYYCSGVTHIRKNLNARV
jgi:hypothetical protein